MEITPDMLDQQVEAFRQIRPAFAEFEDSLGDRLRSLAKKCSHGSVVEVRAKSIASYAEKILRKRKYVDPLREMTDLCGARIVCPFDSDVRAVCAMIRQEFAKAIDETNSLDQRTLLRTGEFGYRSVHYVIELRGRDWPGLKPEMEGKKIELQVRTRLQHIWSDIGHDRIYKSPHPLPDSIRREAARLAAQFESLDEEFEHLVTAIADYRVHFGPYLDPTKLEREKQLQETLRKYDPRSPIVPLRQAEFAMSTDDWPTAIGHIRSFADSGGELTPALEAALGFALCQQDPENFSRPEYKEGCRYLERATRQDPQMLMGWIRRAECAPPTAVEEKQNCFHNAYRLDPADPAALAGYVRWQIEATHDASFIELLRPTLLDAINRCERQAAVHIDLPWTYFRAAFFRLLLIAIPPAPPALERNAVSLLTEDSNARKEMLNAVLKSGACGVAFSRRATPVRVARDAVEALRRAKTDSPEVRIASLFLTLAFEAIESRQGGVPLAERIAHLATPNAPSFPAGERVAVVAGTSRPALIGNETEFERILGDALKEFSGTVISGGTDQGVPGMVGRIGAASNGRIRTIGYIPNKLPASPTYNKDKRNYSVHVETAGVHFSPLEPLQAWIDLLAAGVRPENVTVLGLGGGRIAAFEYRLALLLGARVAVLAGSGREADELASDPVWHNPTWKLWRIPFDAADEVTLRAFMHPATRIAGMDYEALGRMAHDRYVSDNRDELLDPTLREWKKLQADFRDSNIAQVVSASSLLQAVGLEVQRCTPGKKAMPWTFTSEQRDRLARLEHGRWMIERLGAGWAFGRQRDPVRKTHPNLVSWEALSLETQQKDFNAVTSWPELFAAAGYEIVPRAMR